MNTSRTVTAREAAALLNVSAATIYAYVSRGLIRSEPGGGRRERRYSREDVQRLAERQSLRRDPARAAVHALRWGPPVLESALTLIEDGQLYYRGWPAPALAQAHTFEEVVSLLWTGALPGDEAPRGMLADLPDLRSWAPALGLLPAQDPIAAFQLVLPLKAAADPAGHDLRPAAVRQTGSRILGTLTAAAVFPANAGQGGVAEVLARHWAPRRPSAKRLFDAALILSADHELNVSAFVARCVASAAATPYDVVTAGLAALRGRRHGGRTARVEALFEAVGTPTQAGQVLAERLRQDGALPGFGHTLYPEGDPRGRALLDLTAAAVRGSRVLAVARAIAAQAQELTGDGPTLDFGLVVLARALGLPHGAAQALFALGRTAGWIGQALEQYQSGQMIRPRARYVGLRPESQGAFA
ncbi:MAG: citrate synthase family protein [Anaerolineales bacterium]|nr:citrate synthase family protein [Anaerolineales bacterium]